MNPKTPEEILFLLAKGDKNYTQSDLNKLIEFTYKIALHHVTRRQNKLLSLLKRENLSYSDIAIDSIAAIFKQENEGYPALINSFRKWRPEIKTNPGALFFLHQIVSKHVDQRINRILRESNPFFSKILSKISYISRIEGYTKAYHKGTCYLLKNGKIILPVVSPDEFEIIPFENLIDEKLLIKYLYKYLEDRDYYPAIPLNSLVYRLLNVHLLDLNNQSFEPAYDFEIITHELFEKELGNIIKKLKEVYVDTNKISHEGSERIAAALKVMAHDLSNGGLRDGIPVYLEEQLSVPPEVPFNKKYLKIMEYLFKIFKARLAKKLKR